MAKAGRNTPGQSGEGAAEKPSRVVSALCALHTKPFLSREKGGWDLGAMGKEGGEVSVCRRGPGLPGGNPAAVAHPQRQLLSLISAFVRGLQKWGCWGLLSRGPGAWGDRLARGMQREAPLGPWR